MATEEILIERTDEEQKRAIEIHDVFRNELLKRQLSNTENYDKSILTLSSSALAISLTFLNSQFLGGKPIFLWLLKASWLCFLITIILSIVAYLVSNIAITRQLKIAEDYYINKKHTVLNKENIISIINNWLNYAVGTFFVCAILATVFFVIFNLNQGNQNMTTNEIKVSAPAEPMTKSATIPVMQQAPSSTPAFDSALIPTMQAAPGTTTQQSQPVQQTQAQKTEK